MINYELAMLALPVPCLNGASKQTLIDEIMECRGRLEEALRAMRNVEFTNGRNFQLSDSKTHALCVEQHEARCKSVEDASRELLIMVFNIDAKYS